MNINKSTKILNYTIIAILFCSYLAATATAKTQRDQEALYLVKDGEAHSVIVTPKPKAMGVQRAVHELQYHIKRASGVELPVVSVQNAKALPLNTVRIVIGPGKLTRSLGVDASALKPEQYRIKSVGNHLIFAGHDISYKGTYRRRGRAWAMIDHSAATMWAVDRFLDRQLGVLWLWPGKVGTYVPHHETIPLVQLDITARPKMIRRQLRFMPYQRGNARLITKAQLYKVRRAGFRWLARHQMGARIPERAFGHSHGDWWKKYHKKHLGYFAMSPSGKRTFLGKPIYAKLDVSNETVDRQIIANWKAAGQPSVWGVSPNDGRGFSTDPGSMAMDVPHYDNARAVWYGKVSLTARYVKFWNRLLGEMRKIDPNVRLASLVYSAYRNPPPAGVKVHPGMILSVVCAPWQYDLWRGWVKAQMHPEMMLRPNWWHTGVIAPVLPLHLEGGYFKFAEQHGLAGFFFDSPLAAWGNQSPRYYMVARLSERPDLSVDQIINEYCSAFGTAAPAIRDYLNYWENFSRQVGYSYNAGGVLTNPNKGKYIKLVHQYNLHESALSGTFEVIPYLYTDDVLNQAYTILDRAKRMASAKNSYVLERIEFLGDGLDHLKLTRNVLQLGYKRTSPKGATRAEFRKLCQKLRKMRRKLTLEHVIYGQTLYGDEARRHIPTSPSRAWWPKNNSANSARKKLSGKWRFHWDPDKKGINAGWYMPSYDASDWHTIKVDAPWESQPVGRAWRKKHGSPYLGVAWYRTRFDVKSSDKGQTITLTFGAVDEAATIWVNGDKVLKRPYPYQGDRNSWREPFKVDVTNAAHLGKPNTLAVRVVNKSGAGGIWRPVWLSTSE